MLLYLDPMTLVHRPDLDILEVYLRIRNELLGSRISEVRDRQTDVMMMMMKHKFVYRIDISMSNALCILMLREKVCLQRLFECAFCSALISEIVWKQVVVTDNVIISCDLLCCFCFGCIPLLMVNKDDHYHCAFVGGEEIC